MTRPSTRNKNKRQRQDDTEDILSEISRNIHANGEISESDIYKLYRISKKVCEGCRTNLKDSPNCFCGIIPAPNGVRKIGLWQKMSEIISSLGPNPCKDLRSSTSTPAGLTNLGATCYANSILQCLYMNTSFRSGIFTLDIDLLSKHPVLYQLSRLFAQLHSSTHAFIDSDPFIETLELDNGVQQDSHEFLTLFLSLLERSLVLSKSSESRNMIQDLFRGRVSHVTRCSVCGRDSEASSKLEDFYELELNIKGLSDLSMSLEEYLSVEELHGENQYFCESCGLRIDATRSIKLRELPSVLNFQLKRYVFLPKSNTKKKITSKFSFPRILDMSQSMTDPSDSALIYDLSAILIHKGTAANSGHYIAHIKDENTGQWWEFDDEHVSKLGFHPFGEPSKSSEKSVSNEEIRCKEVTNISNGAKKCNTRLSSSEKLALSCGEIFSSSDAYMLMYNRKTIEGDSNIIRKNSDPADIDIGNTLPIHLFKEIHELNASYAKSCEEYQQKKDVCVSHITERRKEVRLILSEAPVHSLEDPYFWVSTEWLRQWADNIEPSVIDNSKIQCTHGSVPFQNIPFMKRVSGTAWHKLLSKYGGGPALSNENQCIECIKEGAKNAICVGDYRDRRVLMCQLAREALTGNHLDDNNLYYVSKSWLIQWLRRKNVDFPCEADASPTASLRCSHGGLLPEQASGAKRVIVTENLWLFYCESANTVKPDDAFGCLPFPANSIPCEECSKELTEVTCHEDNLRSLKLIQREEHDKLISGKSLVLELGCKYFLVPSSWLAKWKAYVTTTGKNISSSAEPENLGELVDSLKCKKHSCLLERPSEVICKRGIITQKSSENGLTLIPNKDWELFCKEWTITIEKGISAEIHFADDISCKVDEAKDESETRTLIIKTNPEICEVCIGEQESCELIRKLNYRNEDIRVFLVTSKEAPKSLLEASWTNSKPDRRISKRCRRLGKGNSVSLNVSCSTTIYQLKMMIWENFGVVKENQQLHKGSMEIEDDIATLADKSIFPGDILWVKDSGFYDNRDIADELSEGKNGSNKTEEGFRGSLLASD